MRHRYYLSLLAVIVVTIGLALVFNQPRTQLVDRAIQKGLEFLATAHAPYQYDDPYLEYVYPGESLDCPLTGCRLTYRLLDAYFMVQMLNERLTGNEQTLFKAQANEAGAVFDAIKPAWRQAKISNTEKSTAEDKDGVALDTYCILGYLENDPAFSDTVLRYLGDDGWLAPDAYTTDRWRNIADESWCLRLLARTNRQPAQFEALIQDKIDQTKQFIEADEPASSKLAVLYHALLILNDLPNTYYASIIAEFQNRSVELIDQILPLRDPVSLGNLVESLTVTGYSNKEEAEELIRELVGFQTPDGAWRDSQDQAPVFSTFRALIGLASYRQHAL